MSEKVTKSAVPAAPQVAAPKRASAPPVYRPDSAQAMAARRVSPLTVYRPNAPATQLRPAPAWQLQAARPVPLTPAETMRRAMAGRINPAGTVQRTTAKLVGPPAAVMPVAVQPRRISPKFGQPFQTETRTVHQLNDIFVGIVRNDYDAAHQINQAIDNHETLEYQCRSSASLSSRGGTATASAPAAEQPTFMAAARAMLAEKRLGISASGSRSGAFAAGVASYVPLDTLRRSVMGYSQLLRDRPRDSIDELLGLIPDLRLTDFLNPDAVRRKVERVVADTEVRVRTAVENARPVPMAIHAASSTVKRGTGAAVKGIRAAKKAGDAAEAYRRERQAVLAQVDDLTRETQEYLELLAAKAAGGTAAGIGATWAAKTAVRWDMRRTGAANASSTSSAASGWRTAWRGARTGPAPGSAPSTYHARGARGIGIEGAWAFGRARATRVAYHWARRRPFPTTSWQVAARAGGIAGRAALLAGGLLTGGVYAFRQQMAPRFDPLNQRLRQLHNPDGD